MLDVSLKEQLRSLLGQLDADYVFDISVRQDHESYAELIELLEETASCSSLLSWRVREGSGLEYSYTKFTLREDAQGHWKLLYWELADESDINE